MNYYRWEVGGGAGEPLWLTQPGLVIKEFIRVYKQLRLYTQRYLLNTGYTESLKADHIGRIPSMSRSDGIIFVYKQLRLYTQNSI